MSAKAYDTCFIFNWNVEFPIFPFQCSTTSMIRRLHCHQYIQNQIILSSKQNLIGIKQAPISVFYFFLCFCCLGSLTPFFTIFKCLNCSWTYVKLNRNDRYECRKYDRTCQRIHLYIYSEVPRSCKLTRSSSYACMQQQQQQQKLC